MPRLRLRAAGAVVRVSFVYTGSPNPRLLRGKVLVRTQVVDVLELRRCRRQVARAQEQDVEVIVSWRRRVHVAAGTVFVCTRVVFRVVHADQRTVVVESLSAPALQITEEVVHSSVGSEVLRDAGPAWLREGNVLPAGDCRAVVGGRGGSRLPEAVGNIRLVMSLHGFERTVTESAMMDAAEWGVWVGIALLAVPQNGSDPLVL